MAAKSKKLKIMEDYFTSKGIEIDEVIKDLINEYIYIKDLLDRMKKQIDSNDLMYSYTNKAGASNMTKNPIVSEYKAYTNEFNKLSKTIIDIANTKGVTTTKDELESQFFG